MKQDQEVSNNDAAGAVPRFACGTEEVSPPWTEKREDESA
jgi:hypothetical protein